MIVSLQLSMKKEPTGETKVSYIAQYKSGDVANGEASVDFAMQMMKLFLPTQVAAMEKGFAAQATPSTPPSTTPSTTTTAPSTGVVGGLVGGLLK